MSFVLQTSQWLVYSRHTPLHTSRQLVSRMNSLCSPLCIRYPYLTLVRVDCGHTHAHLYCSSDRDCNAFPMPIHISLCLLCISYSISYITLHYIVNHGSVWHLRIVASRSVKLPRLQSRPYLPPECEVPGFPGRQTNSFIISLFDCLNRRLKN